MPEGDKKKGFVQVIGSYMKLAYKTWNREHFVSDELIIEDLETLSKGKLTLEEHSFLDDLTRSNSKKPSNSNNRRRDQGGRDNRKGGGRSAEGEQSKRGSIRTLD